MNCFICDTYGEYTPATRDSIYATGEKVCTYHYWCEVDDSEIDVADCGC